MAVAVQSAQSRQELEQALVKRAEAEFEKMIGDAANGNPDAVERKSNRVAEIAKDKAFPMARRKEFQDRCKLLLRQAYEMSVNLFLDDANGAVRAGDEERKNKLITKAKEHYSMALRAGADEDFKLAVKRKLEMIGMTSPAGTSEKAKKAAEDEAAKPQPVSKAPNGVERRRAIRYNDPLVTATIAGTSYKTVNWSIRGLLIEAYQGPLAVGDKVTIGVSWEGSKEAGLSPARVVRRDAEAGLIAVEFNGIDGNMLRLAHAMRLQEIAPSPE
ncbi:MAG: PilZ domain-containing protein [Proteobacteria bacterium]|nr:PilZ domain-containing protein [Pseudomonadota bacterium]MBI3499470.1 PilZ domain-containing protein [Pseudomonadota bacterium]